MREVSVIAAEDTRVARALLSHFEIRGKRLISYNDHNRTRRIPELISLLATSDIALVSDAGTPAISDPGVELVAAARAAGYEVTAAPGASAPVTALSIAGLRSSSFSFVGFLPRTAGDLRRLFESFSGREETLVAFESPQRLPRTLAVLAEALPERRIAVCRELTKLHEEVFTGSAAEARDHFSEARGEVVIVIEGGASTPAGEAGIEAFEAEVELMKALGLTRAQASALLASRYGLSRRRAYDLWLRAGSE
jgi:16S rRNA (cytidine1402-2'-O)-methyltransferase